MMTKKICNVCVNDHDIDLSKAFSWDTSLGVCSQCSREGECYEFEEED